MRAAVVVLIAFGLACVACYRAHGAIIGDADCSGAVTSIDAALILQHTAGLTGSLPCQTEADANQDGTVNAVDATLVLQYVAGLVVTLPPPTGIQCGVERWPVKTLSDAEAGNVNFTPATSSVPALRALTRPRIAAAEFTHRAHGTDDVLRSGGAGRVQD